MSANADTLCEADRVELWRVDQFARQGFDGHAIAALLDWHVDLHETEKLLKEGCSPELVLRIVRPL